MLIIDKKLRTPIYEQIVNQYKVLIACDVLKVGDKLDSVRQLSSELSVNPNTIQKAFTELEERYICHSEAGKGRFITADAKDIILNDTKTDMEMLDKIIYRLVLSGADMEQINNITKKAYEAANKKIDDIKNTHKSENREE